MLIPKAHPYCCNTYIFIVMYCDFFNLVPTPNVTVGSPNICQPLTLECNVTTVRGVISRVDIIWSRGGVVLTRKNNTSVTIRKNSLLFIDTFNISTINTVDREYHCEVVINTTPPVMANGSVSLDLMG